MNKQQFEGSWQQFKGNIKQAWGALSDDDINKMHGKTEELAGILQKKYGYSKDRARKEIEAFVQGLKKNK
jgi:uncharacterized protein YjbJ (UPF0337 family)